MINYLFTAVRKDSEFIYCDSFRRRVSHWLLYTFFNQRLAYYHSGRRLKVARDEVKRLTKKINRLYMICAEYEVYGESYTAEDHKQYVIEDIYYCD